MIPIRTDYRLNRIPWANVAIIVANVALYFLGFNGAAPLNRLRIDAWMLQPDNPELGQFFSSVFLHANLAHLLGNMVFLWVFGNAVNDKFGHVGYAAFYLAGGVLAGVGYLLLSGRAPVLGASGAISAVTGAFLVLLPRTRVTLIAFFIYYIFPFELSSIYFLAFQFVWNTFMSFGEVGGAGGGVAYVAHSSGYVFGIAIAALLLVFRVLPRDPFDLVTMVRDYHRRTSYRRMVAQGYDPFRYVGRPPQAMRVATRTVESASAEGQASRELELRREISAACEQHDLTGASRRYLELVQVADGAVLPRTQQLDVANQLMADQQYPAAADAYERFLRHYGSYEHLGDIHLMLGILYGRYLHQYDRAVQMLERAVAELTDERKVQLARNDLAAAQARLDR